MTWSEDRAHQLREAIEGSEEERLLPLVALLLLAAVIMLVAEFGTDNTDDYYPSFVSAFWPEHMSTNALTK